MKFQLTDSWENVSDQQRLTMVFEGRNHLYGAYIIRQQYNRNKALAMILAPLLIAALTASLWIKVQEDTIPVSGNQVHWHPRPGEISDPEPEPQPAARKPSQKQDLSDQVPEIDPKLPERSSILPPLTGGDWDPDAVPGGKGHGGIGFVDTAGLHGCIGNTGEKGIIWQPDTDATYPGGDKRFIEYITNHFITPQACLESEAIGEVKLMFVVSEAGTLSNFRVLESSASCPEFTDEAIRVLKASPRWIPAIHKGKFTKAWRVATIRLQY